MSPAPAVAFALLALIAIFWLYLALGLFVLLAVLRDDRADRLTTHWPTRTQNLAWALWPLTAPWLMWKARRG